MDEQTARRLLQSERERVERSLQESETAGQEDRDTAGDIGDMADSAAPITAEQADDAVAASLRERLAAIERAEIRLRDGTYGLSVRSGQPIPDERLEADPAAELTVEEAAEG